MSKYVCLSMLRNTVFKQYLLDNFYKRINIGVRLIKEGFNFDPILMRLTLNIVMEIYIAPHFSTKPFYLIVHIKSFILSSVSNSNYNKITFNIKRYIFFKWKKFLWKRFVYYLRKYSLNMDRCQSNVIIPNPNSEVYTANVSYTNWIFGKLEW